MATTANEQRDIDENQKQVQRIQERVFSMSRDIDRHKGDTAYFKMIGRPNQTLEQVIAAFVRDGIEEIDQLWSKHLRKYPD